MIKNQVASLPSEHKFDIKRLSSGPSWAHESHYDPLSPIFHYPKEKPSSAGNIFGTVTLRGRLRWPLILA